MDEIERNERQFLIKFLEAPDDMNARLHKIFIASTSTLINEYTELVGKCSDISHLLACQHELLENGKERPEALRTGTLRQLDKIVALQVGSMKCLTPKEASTHEPHVHQVTKKLSEQCKFSFTPPGAYYELIVKLVRAWEQAIKEEASFPSSCDQLAFLIMNYDYLIRNCAYMADAISEQSVDYQVRYCQALLRRADPGIASLSDPFIAVDLVSHLVASFNESFQRWYQDALFALKLHFTNFSDVYTELLDVWDEQFRAMYDQLAHQATIHKDDVDSLIPWHLVQQKITKN